ncbi:MAG TPA: hypothetical protein IGS53_09765 [Leptolyngbyaceae cyanobacterium M33_DOE_097]|uniref:DUF4242 domain-containing protein n=1 Tax=Oscillatoriales cyanobacterium SpSt-418 TaxID=2282169 RepID=A0A7C3PE59_9CYAN|nr:hypothetical protein [Leptolyngbyaceae cyanobacterium M33_DOE_097]
MKLVVLERTFSPELPVPMTFDRWMVVNHSLDDCLESRQVHWHNSLVSENGDRSICVFEVPAMELVRTACRQARMPFQRVWAAELWVDQALNNRPQGSSVIVAEVDYPQPVTRAVDEAAKQQAAGYFQNMNIQSLCSVVSLDGNHSICVFSAVSAEAVRSLYRTTNMPFQQIWKATLIRPH